MQREERSGVKKKGTKEITQSTYAWLTSPSSLVKGQIEQQRAQVFASVLLPMIFFTLAGIISRAGSTPESYLAPILIALIISYGFSRSRYYRAGIALMIGALMLPSAMNGITTQEVFTGAFIWLAIPILLGSLLLPMRDVLLVVGASFTIILLNLLRSEITLNDAFSFLAFFGAQSLFLVISAKRRMVTEMTMQRLTMAIEQNTSTIMITDTQGIIEYVNPQFTEITGYTLEEVIGRNASILQSKHTAHADYVQLWKTITAGEEWRGEIYNRKKNGDHYWEDTRISSLRDENGKIIQYIAVKEDITARKEAEAELHHYTIEMEKRNKELDAFAHTVAHDLKAPLSAIMIYTDRINSYCEESGETKMGSFVEGIRKNSLKAMEIIKELLVLASVRKAQVNTTPLDMGRIVGYAVDRLEYLRLKKNAKFVIQQDWPEAVGYGSWIEEVWINYISNALKYGGDNPTITLGGKDCGSGAIGFYVQDEGEGLSEEEQSILFTPFTQLSRVKSSGHGLGLSIVRRIMEKLDGEAKVESQVGEGSIFIFTLPPVGEVDDAAAHIN